MSTRALAVFALILLVSTRTMADDLTGFVDRFATTSIYSVAFDGAPRKLSGVPSFIAALQELELDCHLEAAAPPDYVIFCAGLRQDYVPDAFDLKLLLRQATDQMVVMAAWQNLELLIGQDLIVFLDAFASTPDNGRFLPDVFDFPKVIDARPAAFATAAAAWPMTAFYSDGQAVPDGLFGDWLAKYREAGWACLPERLEGPDIQYFCVGPPNDSPINDRILGKFIGTTLTISAIFRNGHLRIGEDIAKAMADFGAGPLGVD